MKKFTSWGRPLLEVFLVVLLLSDFLSIAWPFLSINHYARPYQGESLSMALAVREGTYTYDGNTHPLYAVLLAPLAERDTRFFTRAKYISLFTVLAVFCFFFFFNAVLLDRLQAWIATYILTSNVMMWMLSYQLRPEVPLVLFSLLSWYFIIQGFSKPRQWIGAGLFCGLAYLTKGTGQLMVLAVLLTAGVLFRKQTSRYRQLGYFLVSYAVIAGPLWYINAKKFGNPFFNWSIHHAMWMDQWQGMEASGHLPTVSGYLQTHSLGQILFRQLSGIHQFLPLFGSISLPSRFFFPQWYVVRLWGGLLLLCTLIYPLLRIPVEKVREADRPLITFSLILITVFLLMFSWYHQVSSSERFVLGIIPVGITLAVWWTAQLWRGFQRAYPRWAARGTRAGILLLACLIPLQVLSVVTKIKTFQYHPIATTDQLRPWSVCVENFLLNHPPQVRVAVSGVDYIPLWRMRPPYATLVMIPPVTNGREWTDFLKRENIHWVALSEPESIRPSPYLSRFIEGDHDEVFKMLGVPSGVEKTTFDGGGGAYIFRVRKSRGASNP